MRDFIVTMAPINEGKSYKVFVRDVRTKEPFQVWEFLEAKPAADLAGTLLRLLNWMDNQDPNSPSKF